MQRELACLLDLRNAAALARTFVEGLNYEQFQHDLKTQSAVLHQIIIMGEVVRRIPPEYRAKHPHLPWPTIVGIRNRLVHEYDKVKLSIIWDTVHVDLPELVSTLDAFITTEHLDEQR